MMKKILLTTAALSLVLSTFCSATVVSAAVKPPKKADYAPSATVKPEENEEAVRPARESIALNELPAQMREHNLTILACQAGLDAQKAFDRKAAYDDLVNMINNMVDAAGHLSQMSNLPSAESPYSPADQAYFRMQAEQMNETADSMRKQLKTLKEEEYASFFTKLSRQTENSIQQMILGAESLYINILTTEAQKTDVIRVLEGMERTEQEMNLRYELGQISFQALKQFQSSYVTTKSKLDSLDMAIKNMKASLQAMIGEKPSGELKLAPLPTELDSKLLQLDYEKALELATKASFAVYDADRKLEDAKKELDNSVGKIEKYTYQSAVYTHDAAIQSFQLGFRSLYTAIPTAKNTLETTQRALTYQEQNYAVAQVKYGLGKISYNAFLTTKDDLKAAKAAVASAKISLFSAYHAYRWAVEQGIVPS